MTTEEKQLLLQDLCARLRYGVVCRTSVGDYRLLGIDVNIGNVMHLDSPIYDEGDGYFDMDYQEVKPYLRPMSSMTEEERAEYFTLKHRDKDRVDNIILISEASALMDWLNKEGFDYYGLIEKGLALEAPEGMYNTKAE